MLIDIIFLILLTLGIFKGYRKGLIVGVLSYMAVLVGLAAAMKLSALVAAKLGSIVNISDKWLPFLAFALVLIGVILLVKWIGKAIQYSVEQVWLGWANRLGGIILFAGLYLSVFAIILFYVNQMNLLSAATIDDSVTYDFVKVLGRFAVNSMGAVIPFFKDVFAQLENFFGTAATPHAL